MCGSSGIGQLAGGILGGEVGQRLASKGGFVGSAFSAIQNRQRKKQQGQAQPSSDTQGQTQPQRGSFYGSTPR